MYLLLVMELFVYLVGLVAVSYATSMNDLEKRTEQGNDVLAKQLVQNIGAATGELQMLTSKIGRLNRMSDALQVAATNIEKKLEESTTELVNYINRTSLRTSCFDIYTRQPDSASGIYTIYPDGNNPGIITWCDMETERGGWTVFQHREDGSLNFSRTWEEYKRGFGSANREFWIGNDALHRLTAAKPSVLLIGLKYWDGNQRIATYSNFSVGGEETNYRLSVSGYSGTAGDSLNYHNNKQFSTKDRDNDDWSSGNFAVSYGGDGGWWFGYSAYVNLNGRYYNRHSHSGSNTYDGVVWRNGQDTVWNSLKAVSMMIRPRG